jgi:hypothetical protein
MWQFVIFLSFLIISFSGLKIIANFQIGDVEKQKVSEAIESRVIATDRFPKLLVADRLYLTTLDYWSECITIAHAFSNSKIPFANHPVSENNPMVGDCEELILTMNNPIIAYEYYLQYIHGDSAIVKLFLLFGDLVSGKVIITFLIILIMVCLSIIVFKINRLFALIIVVYFFILTDLLYQGFGFAQGIASCWALLIILLQLIYIKKVNNISPALALIGGSGYAIFSMMNNPVQFVALSSIFTFIALQKRIGTIKASKYGMVTSLFWGIGGVSTIFLHWVLVYLFEDGNEMISMLDNGFSTRFYINPFNSIYIFFGLLRTQLFQFSMSIFGILILMFIWGKISAISLNKSKFSLTTFLYLTSPTSLIILWFLFMGGHIGHGWTISLIYTALINLLMVHITYRDNSVKIEHLKSSTLI